MRFRRDPRVSGTTRKGDLASPFRASSGAQLGEDGMAPKLSEMCDRYITGRVARGEVAPETGRKTRRVLEHMVRVVGDRPARKMDKACAEAWQVSVAHQKASTQRLRHGQISAFCEWLVDEEVLDRNPFRRVKPPKPPRRPPRALPGNAVERLLAVVPDLRARLIVLLMVQQGLRCKGVSSLRVEDVDLEGRWMRVTEKGGHERALWITDECLEVLTMYLERWPCWSGPLIRAWRPSGGPLRTSVAQMSDRGLRPSTISMMMTGWMYEAGIKHSSGDGVSAHALRHTCATDMLDEGADITQVQATLGHANVATTMIYTSVRPEKLVSAMAGRRYGQVELREVS